MMELVTVKEHGIGDVGTKTNTVGLVSLGEAGAAKSKTTGTVLAAILDQALASGDERSIKAAKAAVLTYLDALASNSEELRAGSTGETTRITSAAGLTTVPTVANDREADTTRGGGGGGDSDENRVGSVRLIRDRRVWLSMKMPLVNIFADVFFGSTEAPSREHVNDLLNVLGLISALLLSLSYSAAGSVSFDELQSANARFSSPPYSLSKIWNVDMGDPGRVVYELALFLSLSNNCLGSCIILVLIVYASSVGGLENSTEFPHLRYIWWRSVRWLIILAVLLVAAGAVTCFRNLNRLMFVKFPDMYVETVLRASLANSNSTTVTVLGLNVIGTSTYGVVAATTFITIVFSTVPVLVVSWAKYSMARHITSSNPARPVSGSGLRLGPAAVHHDA